MYDLQKFISLLSLYNSYGSILDKLTEEVIKDLRELKRIFITSVVLNHPPGSFAIERNQYDACVKFLKNFCFIYTLNYDLLLYWVIVKNTNVLKFQDGFSRLSGSSELIWYPESEASTTLYYLHGALHLIQDKQYIKKHSWKCSGIPLKDQIQSKLNQNKLPIFVSGGITSEKASLILKCPYLYSGFNSLSNCNDTLFVHGFGFNSNDLHIIDAIAESNIEKLFISIYKPNENFSDWLKINSAIERINFVRDFLINKKINIDVFYYDAETANVWGNRVKADAKVLALEM